ncbi:Na+/H+ antiporter NhaC [Vibrio sp. 99-8-1]|uniref:Na+/H+ antiporter NhaC n=1 Tax=Vibrio sp. 99-8-1 TaxID=2607602 RepID=UPI0014936128|nr:Na+/H+ antiporter NhaC [Vibrio sp. 99-8-1]NOI68579.1 Na+/H+ antiporter NhaC [Vibrio sp. 99-8-1]
MDSISKENERRLPSFGEAMFPIVFMVLVLSIGMGVLGWPTGVCLLLSAACAGILAVVRLGYTWEDIEKFIVDKIAAVMPPVLIVIFVGFMVATWSYAGTLPMMVYYGMEIIKPEYLLVIAFVLNAILSYVSGASWGAVASIGVALMGVGIGLEVNLAMLAAAVVTGAYFGDKLSPLSDTTNLAAAVTKTKLYDHIKYMLWTTVPSTLVALAFFLVLGLNQETKGEIAGESLLLLEQLKELYSFGILPLTPMLIILLCTFLRQPTVPSMLLSSVVAILVGWQYQGFDLYNGISSTMGGFNVSMIGVDTADLLPAVSELLNRGGLNNNGGFLAFIICAMGFAGILTGTGMVDVSMGAITAKVKSRKSAIISSGLMTVIINMLTGSDGLNKIITTELMQKKFLQLRMHPLVLARTTEDFGTMTGPIIPWSAAGLYMATTLGVPTMDYLPYCVLFFFSMIFASSYAITGFKILTITDSEAEKLALERGINLTDRDEAPSKLKESIEAS